MKKEDYEKVIEKFKRNGFIVLVISTILFIINNSTINNQDISLILYAVIVTYAVATIINFLTLKRIVK